MICEVIDGLKYKPINKRTVESNIYKKFFNIVQDGDILLLSGKSIISSLIGRFTYSVYKWSHVAILFKERNLILRVEATVPRPGIFLFEPTSVLKGNHYFAILRLNSLFIDKIKDKMDLLKETAFKYALTSRYDIRGLLGWLTGRHQGVNSYVCSTFVYSVFHSLGVDIIRTASPDRVSPVDIWQSPILDVVDIFGNNEDLNNFVRSSRQNNKKEKKL